MADIGIRDISVSFRDNKISNMSLVQGDALTRGFDITFVNAKGETLPVDDDYIVELVAVNSKDKDTPYACRHEIVDNKYRVMIPPEALSESGSVTIQLVFYQKSTKAVIHTIKQKCPVYRSIGQEFVESNNLYVDITALRLGLEKIEKLDGKYEEIIEKDMEIQANEAERKEAENKRNLDEEIRKDNERIRKANEDKREQLKTALIELKNSIESDLESINLTVDDIISSEDDRKQNEIVREEIKVELENLVADIQNKLDNGDFVGEKGDQGIQGEQGPQGPPGEVSQEELDNFKDANSLKIAKLEKELQNYKSTMANINVNHEVKQSVSGYGSVSLPKNTANGQVSVSVKGRTLKQEFNYNKDTMEQWSISSNSTKGESKITLKGSGGYPGATLPIFVKPNTKYGILYTVLTSNVPSLHLGSGFHPFKDFTIPTHLGNAKVIQTTKELWEHNSFRFYLATNSTDEHSITISTPRMFELPPGSEIENDFNTMTADQLAQKYPYVSGNSVKSTISASRLKSVGKNLLNVNDGYLTRDTTIDKDIITSKFKSGALHFNTRKRCIRLNPHTKYTFSAHSATGDPISLGLRVYDSDGTQIGWNDVLNNISGAVTLTTPHNGYVAFCTNGIGGFLNEYSYRLQVEKGDTASEYEPYTETTQYLPNVGELRSLPNGVCDEIRVSSGKGEHIKRVSDTMEELAEPIITPINVSGNLISYPSGTVYIEHGTYAVGLYGENGITVTESDLPIKEINKITKIDYETGLEHELDVSKAIVSEDGLLFTHEDLEGGDIVFFDYDYSTESTQGETTIEYYDSRYVIEDTENGNFYQWKISSTNGTPNIELVEV